MTISLNSALSNGYTSNSQKARVLTESGYSKTCIVLYVETNGLVVFPTTRQ